MHLKAFQSDKGDCLLLTNTAGTKRILVDGGMPLSYDSHVAAALGKLATANKALDLVNNIDSDFVEAVIARDYVFCGNGFSGNPNLDVIGMMVRRRLAASPKPFRFWFNSSKAVSANPDHMGKVEALVTTLAATSGGRFTFKFLTKGSTIKIL